MEETAMLPRKRLHMAGKGERGGQEYRQEQTS